MGLEGKIVFACARVVVPPEIALDDAGTKSNMKLSIIVPTEKTPDHLVSRCLRSIGRLCTEHEVITIAGKTLCEARNEGLRHAQGEWVMFVDADDEVLAESIDAIILETQQKVDMYIFGVMTKWGRFGTKWYAMPNGDIRAMNHNLTLRYAWNKIYRRSFLCQHNLLFEIGTEPSEDVIFNLKCMLAKARIRCVDSIGYIYHKRMGSVMFCHIPTLEAARKRENDLWLEYGMPELRWSASALKKNIWYNKWLRGGECRPPIKWRLYHSMITVRRLLRFVGV